MSSPNEKSALLKERRELVLKSDLPHSEKHLLTVLYLYQLSNDECWPSANRLATDCGITKRSVRRRLKNLADAGIVNSETRTNGNRSVTYRSINFDGLVSQQMSPDSISFTGEPDASVTGQASTRATPASGGGGHQRHPPRTPASGGADASVTQVSKRSSINLISNPSEEERIVDLMLQELVKAHPDRRKPDTSGWQKAIGKLLSDGMDEKRILGMWSRAMRDDFWSTRCYTPDDLEKHWQRIEDNTQAAVEAADNTRLNELYESMLASLIAHKGDFAGLYRLLADQHGMQAAQNFVYLFITDLKKMQADNCCEDAKSRRARRFTLLCRGCWVEYKHDELLEALAKKLGGDWSECIHQLEPPSPEEVRKWWSRNGHYHLPEFFMSHARKHFGDKLALFLRDKRREHCDAHERDRPQWLKQIARLMS